VLVGWIGVARGSINLGFGTPAEIDHFPSSTDVTSRTSSRSARIAAALST
jgi:hypothetical protein